MAFSYYIATVYFACLCSSLAVLLVGYRNRDKFTALKFFYLYPLASVIQMVISYVLIILNANFDFLTKIARATETIFLIVEFLIINDFFRQVIKSPKLRQLLKANILLYFAAIILFRIDLLFSLPVHFFIVQACFVLIPTFAYFFEMFKKPVTFNLLTDSSLWVSVGVIFYFSCTLPIFLLNGYILDEWYVDERNLYSINFICYGILFLFITKAYLCPKRSTN